MRQIKSCGKCKFSNLDYIFDDETGEEYLLCTCKKGNDTELDFDCNDFKEYKPKSYKEEDTECDKCDKLSICKKYDLVLRCTTSYDTREHYIVGRRGCYLGKE